MPRITVSVERDHMFWLKSEAIRQGVTVAELVRILIANAHREAPKPVERIDRPGAY